mmetsp:Transcript_53235/g.128961  ORF Transcript_53235/g.128961 Transcript_53235/m.128961 type:complete len:385 (+) Transcript_53235:517-1671(+)
MVAGSVDTAGEGSALVVVTSDTPLGEVSDAQIHILHRVPDGKVINVGRHSDVAQVCEVVEALDGVAVKALPRGDDDDSVGRTDGGISHDTPCKLLVSIHVSEILTLDLGLRVLDVGDGGACDVKGPHEDRGEERGGLREGTLSLIRGVVAVGVNVEPGLGAVLDEDLIVNLVTKVLLQVGKHRDRVVVGHDQEPGLGRGGERVRRGGRGEDGGVGDAGVEGRALGGGGEDGVGARAVADDGDLAGVDSGLAHFAGLGCVDSLDHDGRHLTDGEGGNVSLGGFVKHEGVNHHGARPDADHGLGLVDGEVVDLARLRNENDGRLDAFNIIVVNKLADSLVVQLDVGLDDGGMRRGGEEEAHEDGALPHCREVSFSSTPLRPDIDTR